jgi:hypothetical protein
VGGPLSGTNALEKRKIPLALSVIEPTSLVHYAGDPTKSKEMCIAVVIVWAHIPNYNVS